MMKKEFADGTLLLLVPIIMYYNHGTLKVQFKKKYNSIILQYFVQAIYMWYNKHIMWWHVSYTLKKQDGVGKYQRQ